MQPGDWVYCVNPHESVFGWLGYIDWIRPPECSVVFTRTNDGQRLKQKRRMLIRDFIVIDSTAEWASSEIDAMIDIALDTRDEEWFRELVQRKGGERIGDTAEGLHV